jgi:hypothetical protein
MVASPGPPRPPGLSLNRERSRESRSAYPPAVRPICELGAAGLGLGRRHSLFPCTKREGSPEVTGTKNPAFAGLLRWARLGLNQRPLACEASALPLSYAPGIGAILRGRGRLGLSPGGVRRAVASEADKVLDLESASHSA